MDELVSQWSWRDGAGGWVTERPEQVRKQAGERVCGFASEQALSWYLRECRTGLESQWSFGISPHSTHKLSLRHVRLLLTFLLWKVGSQSKGTLTLVRRHGFRMVCWWGKVTSSIKLVRLLSGWSTGEYSPRHPMVTHYWARLQWDTEADWTWVAICRSMQDMDLDHCGLLRQYKTTRPVGKWGTPSQWKKKVNSVDKGDLT